MIRLSFAGAAAANHGYHFARIFNGCDAAGWQAQGWGRPDAFIRIPDVRVVKVWDEDRSAAQTLAKVCHIEKVVDKLSDLMEGVDGIVVPDDGSRRHHRFAEPLMKACTLPIFIDKPLADNIPDAERIVALAGSRNIPMMSASALRYAKELEEALPTLPQLGDIVTTVSTSPNELIYYGIHGAELFYTVLGPGVEYVHNIGEEGREIVKVAYRDGRHAILLVNENTRMGFRLTLYGTKGWREVTVTDSAYFYSNMLKNFIKMVQTKKPPFPPAHTLDIIRLLCSAKKSRELCQRVYL